MANNRSAFESVPGRDALLEYESKSYPTKTYVERNGLIYKSLTATSVSFVLSQWELVGDLREIRVADIDERNLLTGSTLTGTSLSGSSIHVPILDNTNVLVLDASGDPDVGVSQFARYNYNQGSASWLLLQIGTGSTSAATSIEYSNVLNRPFVVSGVTVNAGAGLAGGGSVFGSIPAAGGVIGLSHADTSSQTNLTPTGRTYIQQLRFDTFGHVTGATQSTWTHPTGLTQNFTNTGRTYIQSVQVVNGHVASVSSSPWTHPDTSSQANSVNAGQTFIQSIFVDGDGHVTGINTGVAAGGGGGGSPLTYNGDSGGALTANSGSTLTFSGGTNILTQRTGNAAAPGLRINFNPAGLANQIQFHGGAGLSASSNLVFSAGTSTLRTSNFVLGALPASGATSDDILVRNVASGGAVRRLSPNTVANIALNNLVANNGLSKAINNSVRLGGALTGNTSITGAFGLFFANNYVTIGSRSGSTGSFSFTVGANNLASGANSVAIGTQTRAQGANAVTQGNLTTASGNNSHAAGTASTAGKEVLASGDAAFIHSSNNASQTNGDGALASQSAILGGLNHNIESGNVRAAIIGGTTIKLTGTTYIDTVAVPSLAIMTNPTVGVDTDDVLIRRSTTGKIFRVTQASLVSAVNGLTKVGSNIRLGGSLTGSTTIGGSGSMIFQVPFVVGSRTGSTGTFSFSAGANHLATALGSVALGQQGRATGIASLATGINTAAAGQASHSGGWNNTGSINKVVLASGVTSFNHSFNNSSQVIGHGALADQSAILGGQNHNIDVGNVRAAIIGGNAIKLTGTTYIDHTAVSNLAIMTTTAGVEGTDAILVRTPTTGRIRQIPAYTSNHSNTIYVSTLGNDSTGQVNSILRPFLTLNAALTAANAVAGKTIQNRVLIRVLPGRYFVVGATHTMISFVDIHFEPDAVYITATSTRFVFTGVDSNIYGEGIIYAQATTGSLYQISGCTTPIRIEAKEYQVTSFNTMFAITASNVYFKFDRGHFSPGGGTQVGTSVGTSDVVFEFNALTFAGSATVGIVNGTTDGFISKMKIIGNKIDVISGFLQSNGASLTEYYVKETNKTGGAVSTILSTNGTSKLKIQGKITHTNGFAPVFFNSNTSRIYLLAGTVIITATANSVASNGAVGCQLVVYGDAYSNAAINAAQVTLALGTFTVDAVNVNF